MAKYKRIKGGEKNKLSGTPFKRDELEKVYDEIMALDHPEPAIYPLDMAGAAAHDYLEMSKVL